jgi:hypothetical protein
MALRHRELRSRVEQALQLQRLTRRLVVPQLNLI